MSVGESERVKEKGSEREKERKGKGSALNVRNFTIRLVHQRMMEAWEGVVPVRICMTRGGRRN